MKTHESIDQYSHMNRKGATHNAIFGRAVTNDYWVLSFWCFVSTAPNTEAEIQLSSTVGVLLSRNCTYDI